MNFGLFLLFDYYEKSCYKHLWTGFCVGVCFHFSWLYTYEVGDILTAEMENKK